MATKIANVTARVQPEIKRQAEDVNLKEQYFVFSTSGEFSQMKNISSYVVAC